jgi:hypothetical protein
MRLYCLAALTLLIILEPAPQAFAFSTDPTSGVKSDGTPRFMDPDEQVVLLWWIKPERRRMV